MSFRPLRILNEPKRQFGRPMCTINAYGSKVLGVILRPYNRIGGSMLHAPPVFACVQTDGSFRSREPKARIAVLLRRADGNSLLSDVQIIHANNSTEAEWASVAHGLQFSLENNETTIALENDNLGVVQSLINTRAPLRHDFAKYYRHEIQILARESVWTGIRWIPRIANRADALFR